MTGPERRQTPRTTMDKHAYINIEPNNGGIVLNVSDGGLCFHSFDPVRKNGTIRFWFSQQNQRIEADADLAWTDATQKGGLRFTALPDEAREQIRKWISQPGEPIAVSHVVAPPPAQRAFPPQAGSAPEAKEERAPAVAVPISPASMDVKAPTPLRGFSGGFAAGLAVSLLVTGAFLFHTYRHQVGESLIRVGERFAAGQQVQTQTVQSLPETAAPAPRPIVTASQKPAPAAKPFSTPPVTPARQTVSSVPAPAIRSEKMPDPLPNPEKLKPAKLETAALTSPGPIPGTNSPVSGPAIADPGASVTRSAVSSPSAELAPEANSATARAAASPKPEPVNTASVRSDNSRVEGARASNADATSQMFFEVGGFKSKQQAHDATDQLAQLGFPATAVHKNHLWADAYHVLVGPYEDDEKAEATHQNLVSHGFKPRPFERGSRNLILRSGVTLNGTHMPVGECVISWESYVSDAQVKFLHDNNVVTTTSGKWVKREVKYSDDAYVYRKNGDGSRTLLEIRFAGMRQALVFGKPS